MSSNQRGGGGGFRFRIPWLGAAPVPRPMTTENQTSPGETTTQVTSNPAVSRTLAIAPQSGTGSVPLSPPPSPPLSRVPMSPRMVFSPRLIPRSANDQFVTTSQLTTPLQSSPPPSLPASLPSSPTRAASQPSVVSTPRQTPPRYHSASPPSSPTRAASQPSALSTPPRYHSVASPPSSPTRAAPQPSALSTPPRYFSLSPTRAAPQPLAASTQPSRYSLTSPILSHASQDRKAASPVPEPERESTKQELASPQTRFPPPATKNNTESHQTGTTSRPTGMKVEPHLPSEKVVSDKNLIVAPPKPRPELEKHPKDQTDEGNKKSDKGKGPLKGSENKSKKPQEETRRKSRRATYTYTFHGKPPVKTHPPPPPPPQPSLPPPPPSLQKSIKEEVSKLIHNLTTGQPKKYQIGERETLVDMVTLAGENKGAMMSVGSEASKEKPIHIHREYKTNPDASITDDEDEEVNEKYNQSEEEEEVDQAFVNSNVQGVNNSMVIDSSVCEKNPGVHMAISVVDNEEEEEEEELFQSPETLPETRRAEFSPTLTQKLTYDQPMVKRRCLRGLFMESSDSDLDDQTKPRRHGCRYGCGDYKSKDKGKGFSISS